MTTDLRDELARLADGTSPVAPPGDLWSRGVRRRRRTRLATALGTVAAVLAAVLLSTVGWDAVRTTEPAPAATDGLDIPSRLDTPSKFTATTSDGPIGPLAAVAGAEQASSWLGGSTNGLVGVAAATGEYRFLELPDALDAGGGTLYGPSEPALSPDGRSVAYWLRQADHPDRVGGFAVYDTVSGDVIQHEVASDLGLWADAMTWVGPRTLLLTFGEVTEISSDGSAGEGVRSRLWAPTSDTLTPVQGGDTLSGVSPLKSGFASMVRRGLASWAVPSGERLGLVTTSGARDLQEVSVDPSGRTVVGMGTSDSTVTSRLVVGEVIDDAVALAPLRSEVALWDLLGWQDAQHVLVRGAVPGTGNRVAAVFSVDVTTGEADELVREARQSWGAFPLYASDLWARPTADRPGPDQVLDPRLRAAGAAALVLVLGGLVLRVRRRRVRA